MKVVVVGLGAMGLPAARVLAERGHHVIGIDRHHVGAAAGSSSGSSRVFRLSHADRGMTRFATAAYAAWQRLESRVGKELILRRGLLERGEPALDTARALAAEGLDYRELDEADVAARFPELAPRPGVPAIVQEDAGTLLAAETLMAELGLARAAGAEIAERERVLLVEPGANGVRVVSDLRTVDADVAVVCAGPWAAELLAPLGLLPPLLSVPAQVTYFACDEETHARPCVVDWREFEDTYYGMPVPGRGYKLGLLDWSRRWDPNADSVPEDAAEQAHLAALVAEHLPGLGAPLENQTCPVTLSADGKFVLDRRDRLVVGTGCSGQGFKFAPLFGEVLADLAEDRPRDPLLDQFRLGRPGLDREILSIRDLVLHTPAE